MVYELPELEYEYDALEPHMDAKTMEIHYSKHHQGYVDKLNKALEKHKELGEKSAEELVANLSKVPATVRGAVQNNAGGHVNHSLFWQILTGDKKENKFEGDVAEKIESTFSGLDKFKEEFTNQALSRFGSGWTWLVVNEKKHLEIITTANQDSPLTLGKVPILGLDVWEHAYYLNYQNRRADYVEAFWSIVNWKRVNEFYKIAVGKE